MAKGDFITKSGMKISLEGDANEIAEIILQIERREKRMAERKLFFEDMLERKNRNRDAHNSSNASNKNLTEFLISFINEGFFDKPRKIKKIMKKLGEEGICPPSTTVHPVLSRLVAHNKLKRERSENGIWEYMKNG